MFTKSFVHNATVVLTITLFFLTPFLIHAQATSSTELRAIIRAAILKDPRAAGLQSQEIDAMVEALTVRAQTQGVTPQDLTYVPGTVSPDWVPPESSTKAGCADTSSPLCALGYAMGFGNPDKRIPIGLWLTSGVLIFVIWRMQKLHLHSKEN